MRRMLKVAGYLLVISPALLLAMPGLLLLRSDLPGNARIAFGYDRGNVMLRIVGAHIPSAGSPVPPLQLNGDSPSGLWLLYATSVQEWSMAGISWTRTLKPNLASKPVSIARADQFSIHVVMLLVITLVMGTLGIAALRTSHSRLTDSGCCRNCGYDLRATPERCPECGAVAGVKA